MIPVRIGRKTVWIRIKNPFGGYAPRKYMSIHVNILSARRRSMFGRDYVLSKGVVMLKLSADKTTITTNSHGDNSSQKKRKLCHSKMSESCENLKPLHKCLLEDFEVAAVEDLAKQKPFSSNVIDQLFDLNV